MKQEQSEAAERDFKFMCVEYVEHEADQNLPERASRQEEAVQNAQTSHDTIPADRVDLPSELDDRYKSIDSRIRELMSTTSGKVESAEERRDKAYTKCREEYLESSADGQDILQLEVEQALEHLANVRQAGLIVFGEITAYVLEEFQSSKDPRIYRLLYSLEMQQVQNAMEVVEEARSSALLNATTITKEDVGRLLHWDTCCMVMVDVMPMGAEAFNETLPMYLKANEEMKGYTRFRDECFEYNKAGEKHRISNNARTVSSDDPKVKEAQGVLDAWLFTVRKENGSVHEDVGVVMPIGPAAEAAENG
jgi:hypothetical protein